MTAQDLIAFEEEVASLFKQGKIRVPIHLSGSIDGKYEEWLVEYFKKIRKEDYVFSTHRNHYHYLLKTGDPYGLLAEIRGWSGGINRGCSGSMHTCSYGNRFYSSAIVGGTCAIACGVAWAIKQSKLDKHVYCFVGDGATDTGHYHEAVRYAVGHDLPITFIVENNNRSVCTDIHTRWGINMLTYNAKVEYIDYEAKYPHAGCGEYIPL